MLFRPSFVALCLAGVSVDAWQIAVKPQLQLSRVAPRAAVPVLQAAAAAAGDEEEVPPPAPILTTRSMLDTTEKFDAIAAGAAMSGSAAAALGREPGTCDPYDPKSADFCMDETQQDCSPRRRRLQPRARQQPHSQACNPLHPHARTSGRSRRGHRRLHLTPLSSSELPACLPCRRTAA